MGGKEAMYALIKLKFFTSLFGPSLKLIGTHCVRQISIIHLWQFCFLLQGDQAGLNIRNYNYSTSFLKDRYLSNSIRKNYISRCSIQSDLSG